MMPPITTPTLVVPVPSEDGLHIVPALEPRPVDLPALAGQCDLIVSHGGHGTTAQALLAGIPILTFPQHLEQATLAHRVAAVGAGKAVAARAEGIDYGTVMAQLVEAGAARAAAERFAAKHRDFDAEAALEYARGLFAVME